MTTWTLDQNFQVGPERTACVGKEGGVISYWTAVMNCGVLHYNEEFLLGEGYLIGENALLNRLDGILTTTPGSEYNLYTCQALCFEDTFTRAEAYSYYNNGDKWFLLVALTDSVQGTVDVAGFNAVDGGNTKVATATPTTGNGYVCHGWQLDGGAWTTYPFNGNVAEYTVAAQTVDTTHTLNSRFLLGWCVTGTATTNKNGYNAVSSGATLAVSQVGRGAGYHCAWYLDGNLVGGTGDSYTIPAQANGSSHTIDVQFVPN